MISSLIARVRALLRDRNWIPDGADISEDDWGGPLPYGPVSVADLGKARRERGWDFAERCEPDPEWEELVAWALAEPAAGALPLPLPGKGAAVRMEEEEWEWLIARAKAESAASIKRPLVGRGRQPPPIQRAPSSPRRPMVHPRPEVDEAAEWARLLEQAKTRRVCRG